MPASAPAAAAVLAAFLGLTAALAVLLLLLNWRHRRADRREAELRATMRPILAAWAERPATADEIARVTSLPRDDERTALAAALEALAELPPQAAGRLRAAIRVSGLARRELGRLAHRDPARRAAACQVAGRIRQTGAIPVLRQRLRDPAAEVRRAAVGALGELGAVEAIEEIAETIEELGEWSNLLLVMALVRLGPAAAPAIARLLGASRSAAMTKALLQATGRIGVAADPFLVRTLASHPDGEIRVEAVRVLGAIPPDPASAAVCFDRMDDVEWPVRALAARSIGRLGDARALGRLRRAMGDPAYWVRQHVADAMAALGAAGVAALRDGLTDENPFVRDMAAQALYLRAAREGTDA